MMKPFFISLLSILSITSFAEGNKVGGREDHAKVKEAVEACFQEKGLTRPEKGVKLSEEARSSLQSCMKGKGFKNFKGPRRSKQENL
jgi:hypothetical protein